MIYKTKMKKDGCVLFIFLLWVLRILFCWLKIIGEDLFHFCAENLADLLNLR